MLYSVYLSHALLPFMRQAHRIMEFSPNKIGSQAKSYAAKGNEHTVSATLTVCFLSFNKAATSKTITLTFSGGNSGMVLTNRLIDFAAWISWWRGCTKDFFMKACDICFWKRCVFIQAWDEREERGNSSNMRGKAWRLHSGNSANALPLLTAGRCRSGGFCGGDSGRLDLGSGIWKSHFDVQFVRTEESFIVLASWSWAAKQY